MKQLEKAIGYSFKNKDLLTEALTHSSYANESKRELPCNERLEFLGDSVLSIITSKYLFDHYKELQEGDLSKLRASAVCEKALAGYALKINLGDFLLLGKGEVNTQGNRRPSILADAFEALVAAVYLDGGYLPASKFVLPFIKELLSSENGEGMDYKTILQEIIQQSKEEKIRYQLDEESGPDHDKRFVVTLYINSNPFSKGEGKSKKEAEQAAAKGALLLMGYA